MQPPRDNSRATMRFRKERPRVPTRRLLSTSSSAANLRLIASTAALACALAVAPAAGYSRENPVTRQPGAPTLGAISAILVDAETGQVLFEKNADARRPPASTTKIMTATLLLERTLPSDIIVASKRAAETEGSSLNLKPGERISAKDMLFGLMLRSANDGCVAVAEHIAGTERAFAAEMTKKARSIGAASTTFRNSNGMPDPPNVTTARDLATMARYAAQYPAFNEVTRTKYRAISRSINSKDTRLTNQAKILWRMPEADGIKTGYTTPAGRCFVGSATRGGWRLISVVLHAKDKEAETAALLKYGFAQFERIKLVEPGTEFGSVRIRDGEQPSTQVVADGALTWIRRRGSKDEPTIRATLHSEIVAAPCLMGSKVGRLDAIVAGRTVVSVGLVTASAAALSSAAPSSGFLGGRQAAFVLLLIGCVYAAKTSKDSRRRRDRLKAALRGDYLSW